MKTIMFAAALIGAVSAASALAQPSPKPDTTPGVGSTSGVAGVPGSADANGNSPPPATPDTKHIRHGGSAMAMNPTGEDGDKDKTRPAGSKPATENNRQNARITPPGDL